MFKKSVFARVFVACTLTALVANDGSLDTTFNPSGTPPGTVVTNINSGQDRANSIAAQADGKIIAGGFATFSGANRFTLIRYSIDGSLDITFGTNGVVTTAIGTNASINSIALQSDGKIVAGGRATIGGSSKFVVARYNTNGSLDTAFGINGTVNTTIGTNASINSIALQSDGKIIAGGNATIGGIGQYALARYNTNGSLDTTFSPSGTPAGTVVTTIPTSTVSGCASIALQSDGKIVAGGSARIGGSSKFAVARYNSDGSLDSTFDSDGTLTTPIGTNSSIASIALAQDGKIIAGGNASIGGIGQCALARYNSNGALDSTFGSGGVVATNIGNFSYISSIALQPNTKIIAGGAALSGSNPQFLLVRYNSNGALDGTFGSGGVVITTIIDATNDNEILAITLQANGKLAVAGFNVTLSGDNGFAVARYTAFTIFKKSAIAKAIGKKYCPNGLLR